MSLFLVLSLQTAAVTSPAPPATSPTVEPRIAAIDFDLARIRSEGGDCGGGAAGEVLVCGRRRSGGAYPLDHWDRIFGPERPIRAEMGLGGNLTGRIYSDAVPMDRGLVSNRVMVGIKLPF